MDLDLDSSSASSERNKLPLRPVSPSRENRRPTSPPFSTVSPTRFGHDRFAPSHGRSGSDVQNKVAAFNNLTREAAQRRKDNEAALKRAMLGREEAESETKRLKAENDTLRRIAEEGRVRERKVGERVESLMGDLQQVKEAQVQAQAVYEKEVRKARKEAFKSSSALVKLQEELKTARNRFTLMRVDAEEYKQKLGEKEKELSAVQQQLMTARQELDALMQHGHRINEGGKTVSQQESEGIVNENRVEIVQGTSSNDQNAAAEQKELQKVSEELFILQQKLGKTERKIERVEMQKQVVEEERDALKKTMEEEQIAKSAAQGAIALPPSRDTFGISSPDQDEVLEEPKNDKGSEEIRCEPPEIDEILKLKEELESEKRRRFEAEEQVHFSQIECQFGCCSCRRAEQLGKPFIYDDSFRTGVMERTAAKYARKDDTTRTQQSKRPRSQQPPIRSATPKMTMPQRPRSQQATGRQMSPKLLERPRSQQTGNRHNTPRPYQHNRSVTETAFKTAKELDLQAKRSISHARNSSATPGPPSVSRRPLDDHIVTVSKIHKNDREPNVHYEHMLELDFSSPWPKPPTAERIPSPAITAPTAKYTQPPSPTLDFNFTEIIPNIPSIPRPLPTPPPPSNNHDDILFGNDAITAPATITIPIKDDTSEGFSPPLNVLGGISREEALEQIRARRGRARSYAASHVAPTPKRGITGTPRREISAPSLKRA